MRRAFSTPMPFNTLLWRVVVMTPDGFMESRAFAGGRQRADAVSSNMPATPTAWPRPRRIPAVRELRWFTHGFLKAQRHEGELVLADLRMGAEPDYSFRFVVARGGRAADGSRSRRAS